MSLTVARQTRLGLEAAPARRLASWLGWVLLPALALSPLLWVSVPPLVDYPNHLARMWILVHGAEIPELARNYAVHWHLLPNLAMDLVVPALAQAMPVEVAGRLFVGLTLLLLVLGTAALHRVLHGRVGLWPLASLLFLYNAALFWGFVNFLFGIGAFLLAFSGWIASRERPLAGRVLGFAAVAALLLVLHLFAFGLYGLSVMAYELGNRLRQRNLTRASLGSLCLVAAQFLPGGLLWLGTLGTNPSDLTWYGIIPVKLYAFAAPMRFGAFGTASFTLDALLLLFCCGFLIFAVLTHALTLAPAMRAPLVAMLLVAAVMPDWLHGIWGVDLRLPIALAFVIIAGTRLDAGHRRGLGLFCCGALALLAARVWTVTEAWREDARRFAEFRAADRVIAPGARLLVVEATLPASAAGDPDLAQAEALQWPAVFRHMPNLAVIDRSAFVPYLFAVWTPVSPTERNARLFEHQWSPLHPQMLALSLHPERDPPRFVGETPYTLSQLEKFDYVLSIDFGRRVPLGIEELFRPVARGSFFEIYARRGG